jgi:CBS domain-containing protein
MDADLQYGRLSQALISPRGCYLLEAFNPPPVTMDSPALDVMTDLSQVPAATIGADASLDEANRSMIARGVRLLLVVDNRRITGLITTVDTLGEKAMLVAQTRQSRPTELRVADVMVPVDQMEALRIEDVRKASVGNIVATLKADGRAHALVLDHGSGGKQVLQGIFSASQIARQLGEPVHTYEVARTFAEIEAVIAAV